MTTTTNTALGPGGEDCPAAVSLAGLARTVEALDRRVTELAAHGKRIGELAAMVERLARQADAGAGAKKDAPSKVAPSWLDSDADVRGFGDEILSTLANW